MASAAAVRDNRDVEMISSSCLEDRRRPLAVKREVALDGQRDQRHLLDNYRNKLSPDST
jgi:hypothetical protein